MARVSKNIDTTLCLGCSKIFDEDEFYGFKNGEFLPYCKDCCESLIQDDFENISLPNFTQLLKKVDKPFYYNLWQDVLDNGEPYFAGYLKLLEKEKKITKKYKDGDNVDNNEELKVDYEALEKWGVSNPEDVDFLEKEYHDWETSYEIDSKAMIDSVKQLCLIELDIRKARKKSDVLALDKLLRIKSQILGDANLKPVQETGNAANEQVSIGMLIKKFEQEEPIPEDTAPDWIDEMKIWIVGQLARMEGLQSDVTEDFNKELSKYGIDMEVEEKLGDV